MLTTLYDVSVALINQHIKKIYDDSELEPVSTIKKYLIIQNKGNRQVSREVMHYNLQMIIAVGFKKFYFCVNKVSIVSRKLCSFIVLRICIRKVIEIVC